MAAALQVGLNTSMFADLRPAVQQQASRPQMLAEMPTIDESNPIMRRYAAISTAVFNKISPIYTDYIYLLSILNESVTTCLRMTLSKKVFVINNSEIHTFKDMRDALQHKPKYILEHRPDTSISQMFVVDAPWLNDNMQATVVAYLCGVCAGSNCTHPHFIDHSVSAFNCLDASVMVVCDPNMPGLCMPMHRYRKALREVFVIYRLKYRA
mgnify:CR=1 FL=1